MPFARQLANANDCAIEVKREFALEARIAGATFREIAKAIGMSVGRAHELVMQALAEQKAVCVELAAQVREVEVARLDAMHAELWDQRGDPRTADTLLRIAERRSKLLGLDEPAQFRLGGVAGAPVGVAHGYDLGKLSVEELQQLDAIRAKAIEPAGTALPSALPSPTAGPTDG